MSILLLHISRKDVNLKSIQLVQSPFWSKFPCSITEWSSGWIGAMTGLHPNFINIYIVQCSSFCVEPNSYNQ